MMLVAGYFRMRNTLPEPVWKYPLSYVAFHTYSIQASCLLITPVIVRFSYTARIPTYTCLYMWTDDQHPFYFGLNTINLNWSLDPYLWSMFILQGLLENEYVGTNFAVGQVRTISGVQSLRASYNVSSSRNAKWENLLVLFLMAIGYRILLFVLLCFNVRKSLAAFRFLRRKRMATKARWSPSALFTLVILCCTVQFS